MILSKRLADLLTSSRFMLALVFAWLGLTRAAELLPVASFLLLASWISDLLDGPLALHGRGETTWIGDHDLEADVFVSLGALAYLVGAGFLALVYTAAYLLLWAVIFWRWGWNREPAMLFQAPIYLWFIIVAMQHAPLAGWWLIAYVGIVIVLTWPHFPREVVPGFLAGMSKVMKDT